MSFVLSRDHLITLSYADIYESYIMAVIYNAKDYKTWESSKTGLGRGLVQTVIDNILMCCYKSSVAATTAATYKIKSHIKNDRKYELFVH